MSDHAKSPVFIGCSHGTDDSEGRAAVRGLLDAVREMRPSLDVREAFVDVQDPGIDDVVAGIQPDRPAVIVPLLLSAGYHVHVDIARAAASRPGTRAASTLGPDSRLTDLLADSLARAGEVQDDSAVPYDAVVLAAAGSSDARALADVDTCAGMLDDTLRALFGDRHTTRPTVAYAAGGRPRVGETVAHLRAGGRRVAVASYLLAPGFFASLLGKAGADVVTPPLLPGTSAIAEAPTNTSTRVVAQVALDRFDAAVGH